MLKKNWKTSTAEQLLSKLRKPPSFNVQQDDRIFDQIATNHSNWENIEWGENPIIQIT